MHNKVSIESAKSHQMSMLLVVCVMFATASIAAATPTPAADKQPAPAAAASAPVAPSTPPPAAASTTLAAAASPTSSAPSKAPESKPASSVQQRPQQRQSAPAVASGPTSLIGAIGSLVPNLVTNVAPLVLLFGLSALVMPALGNLGAGGLLRDSRRSGPEHPSQLARGNLGLLGPHAAPQPFGHHQGAFVGARPLQPSAQDVYYISQRSLPGLMSHLSGQNLLHGLNEVLVRVNRAIENADKRYS